MHEIKNVLLNTLFGSLVCLIIGTLIYGTEIFYVGLYGAIFFSVLKCCSLLCSYAVV